MNPEINPQLLLHPRPPKPPRPSLVPVLIWAGVAICAGVFFCDLCLGPQRPPGAEPVSKPTIVFPELVMSASLSALGLVGFAFFRRRR